MKVFYVFCPSTSYSSNPMCLCRPMANVARQGIHDSEQYFQDLGGEFVDLHEENMRQYHPQKRPRAADMTFQGKNTPKHPVSEWERTHQAVGWLAMVWSSLRGVRMSINNGVRGLPWLFFSIDALALSLPPLPFFCTTCSSTTSSCRSMA